MKLAKTQCLLFVLVAVAFFYRAYPHLFLVTRWLACEEDYQWAIVKELVENKGVTKQIGFQPFFEHYLIYYFVSVFPIDPIRVCQYINPLAGAVTIIPLYLIGKRYLTKQKTLLFCILIVFSEVAFYRTAKFGTTEGFSLFLALWALYFYVQSDRAKINYVFCFCILFLSLNTHLLPFICMVAVIGLNTIAFRPAKEKILTILCIVFVAFLIYSPLSPAQRSMPYLRPTYMFSKIDAANIVTLYDIAELVEWGGTTFLGSLALFVTFALQTLKSRFQNITQQPNVFLSFLMVSMVLFAHSWIGYNGAIYSPVRLIVFLVVPVAFFAVRSLTLFKTPYVLALSALMVSAATLGCHTVLWVGDSVTAGEYKAVEELVELHIFDPYESTNEWFVDLSAQAMMKPYEDLEWNLYPDPETLETDIDNASAAVYRARALIAKSESIETVDAKKALSRFSHVFLSERMAANGYFRDLQGLEVFSGRTYYLHVPVRDLWANSTDWELVYDNYGVKVYEPRT